MVRGVAWLRVLWLFGLSLYKNSVYLVYLCFLCCSRQLYLVIDLILLISEVFIRIGPIHLALISSIMVYLLYFNFMSPAHYTCIDLDFYRSIIAHISSSCYIDTNPFSFQYWVSLNLNSANMARTAVEYF